MTTLQLTILAMDTGLWARPLWDYIIMGGLFGMVVLVVVSIFGQSGQIQLSPQREAAIATGHTDRKTVFENPALRPLLWMLLSISHSLRVPKAKAWIRRQLVAAGSPNYYTPEEYLALSMFGGVGLGILLLVIYFLLAGTISVFMAILGFGVGMTLTLYQISETASKRLTDITRRLPYALDLISLAMGAGATFTEAVKTIVREGDDDALSVELRALLAEIDLGTTRRQALRNMAARVPIEAMGNLVASVMQAEELGTPLGTVLHDQAVLLRMQRSVRAENKAAVASVRILVPCLLLVMAVILTVFGPAILRISQRGLF